MRTILFFAIAGILAFLPFHAAFAEMTEISVPQPIGDFVESLKEINIDNINEKISDNISFGDSVVAQKLSDAGGIQEIWDTANEWMREMIGISLGQIIGAIGNFIMWILELAIGLLKGGLSELGA